MSTDATPTEYGKGSGGTASVVAEITDPISRNNVLIICDVSLSADYDGGEKPSHRNYRDQSDLRQSRQATSVLYIGQMMLTQIVRTAMKSGW